MKKNEILKAWRNADAFHTLSAEEQRALPESPAGLLAVDDEVLSSLTGGCSTTGTGLSAICTPCPPKQCY